MSVPKTSVSTLQEFCSRQKLPAPVYTTIADDELGFICEVDIMDFSEKGNGRSKRDAKHAAASAAVKRLVSSGRLQLELKEIAAMVEDNCDLNIPPVDMVMTLRDYCVQMEHPLPKFELVKQYGTPNAPRFTILCQIATIIRYGTSESKKDARQKAAFKMLEAIKDPLNVIDKEMEVVSVKSKIESAEEERYLLFKTYNELIESGHKTEGYGVRMDERHDFYTRFHTHLKDAAKNILNTTYESEKTKAFDVLNALKLKYKMDKVPSVNGAEMIFMEIDCKGLDTCFAGFEKDIYTQIISYFNIMLQ